MPVVYRLCTVIAGMMRRDVPITPPHLPFLPYLSHQSASSPCDSVVDKFGISGRDQRREVQAGAMRDDHAFSPVAQIADKESIHIDPCGGQGGKVEAFRALFEIRKLQVRAVSDG